MKYLFYLIPALLGLAACQKHMLSSSNRLAVSIDPSKGAILTRSNSDTFLVRLTVPDSMNAVPLVYSLPTGSRASSGRQVNERVLGAVAVGTDTWKDTVDLSGNKVHLVTVTAADGLAHQYAIAFEYVIEATPLPSKNEVALCFGFDGNTIYAGTNHGLLRSTDGGASYALVPGVGIDPIVGYSNIHSVYGRGNTIYAATDSGVAVSADGGNSWVVRVLKPRLPGGYGFPVAQLCVQGDTVYAACEAGVYISRDRGVSFDSSANNFQPSTGDPFPGIWSIYAQGSTVYAGGQTGFYISVDGGRHFTGYNSLEGKEDYPERVNGIVVNGGSIFAATIDGLFVSPDAGQDFSGLSYGGYFSNTGMVAANNSTVCSAGTGLFISPDGGKTFAQYTAASGLGGELGNAFWTWSVAMNGSVIYCGNQNYISRLTPR